MNKNTYENYKAHLEDAARDYRWACGLHAPPYDPKEIARMLGVEVIDADLDGLQGYVEHKDNKWSAYISRRSNSRRRRFTLAHELGHVVLARAASGGSFDGLIRYRTDGTLAALHQDPAEESLCNVFAAELLLPANDLRERFCTSCVSAQTVLSLSKAFHVSLQTVARKLVRMVGEHKSACQLWNLQALWPVTQWGYGVKSLTKHELSEFEGIVAAAHECGPTTHYWASYGRRLSKPCAISLLPLIPRPLVLSFSVVNERNAVPWCSHSRQLSLW